MCRAARERARVFILRNDVQVVREVQERACFDKPTPEIEMIPSGADPVVALGKMMALVVVLAQHDRRKVWTEPRRQGRSVATRAKCMRNADC
jgi:hypothetical protein